MRKRTVYFLLAAMLACVPIAGSAQSQPDILMLGDSQISFGAGEIYQDYFKNLAQNCAGSDLGRKGLAKLGQRRMLAVGVRSTSLHSWTARGGAAKDTICEVDKKFGVNAGAYGIKGSTKRKFIQIGKEPGFQICKPNQSAFEGVFDVARIAPKLLILNVLGNAEKRWSESQAAADMDMRMTLEQIPRDVPCIIYTTAPVFSKATNDRRMQAQARLEQAVRTTGGHCRIVKGYTPETRAVIEGQAQFFRRDAQGKILDRHHPNQQAIRNVLRLTGPELCDTLAMVLK